MSESTRPQPSAGDAEPVAWMYDLDGSRRIYETRFPMQIPGWTETPLYTASALEQVRKDALPLLQLAIGALTEAREALHFHYVEWDGEPEDAVPLQLARAKCDQAISVLKDQANG